MRKLLRRANFPSQGDLKTRILEFIEYFNRTMVDLKGRWNLGRTLLAGLISKIISNLRSFF